MNQIGKVYGSNRVLKGVSLAVKPGEIHALLGENGAGKSTLMNILFGMGVIHATGGFEGSVEIAGQPVHIKEPREAMNYGIGMVHQEFMLIPGFTVTENIKVGREICKKNIVSAVFGKAMETLDRSAMDADARKALKTVGLNIEEYTKIEGLPVGHMQFIEIAREIDKKGIKLLVFDEPTAVLTESEAEQLLNAMRSLAKSGIAIIFITHRLSEVMAVADEITVLRDGESVYDCHKADTTVEELAQVMIGRQVTRMVGGGENRNFSGAKEALVLKDFYVDMPGEQVKGVDMVVRDGEIFGIGGLAGQGKMGIPNGIMNLFEAAGEVTVYGNKLALNKLGAALKLGIASVSEDRRGVGLMLDQSIESNICFSAMQVHGDFLHFGPIAQKNAKAIRGLANQMITELDIRCAGPTQPVGSLSGGNQQKVCLSRALALHPKILIVAEPTRGIDIGAKELVLKMLVRLNQEQGMTVLMVSSELVELRSICDRIAIVSDGTIVDVLPPDASDVDFGLAMGGHARDSKGVESA